MTVGSLRHATLLPGAVDAPAFLATFLSAAAGRALPGPLAALDAVDPVRESAVFILFSDGDIESGGAGNGPDLLITGRAGTLRAHGGQPAFPGGAADPGEDAVTTAVREAVEETGLDPTAVLPVLQMPGIALNFSGYRVTPVVGWWRRPGPVRVVDPAETSVVARIPIAQLTEPAHRGVVRLSSGHEGPAFAVADLVIWGFTGILLDAVLDLGGWTRPWGPGPELSLPHNDSGRVHQAPTAGAAGFEISGEPG